MKLDQRQRQLIPKLARGDTISLFCEIFQKRVEQGFVEKASHILVLLERECLGNPPEYSLPDKQVQSLRKALSRMTTSSLMKQLSLPATVLSALEELRLGTVGDSGAVDASGAGGGLDSPLAACPAHEEIEEGWLWHL